MVTECNLEIAGIQTVFSANEEIAHNQKTSDIAYAATEKLLRKLKWSQDEIRTLILVTQTSDYLIPSTASLLQKRLHIGFDCLVYDINAGGNGFVTGMQVSASLLQSFGVGKKGILVCADVQKDAKCQTAVAVALQICDSAKTTILTVSDSKNWKTFFQKDKYQTVMESPESAIVFEQLIQSDCVQNVLQSNGESVKILSNNDGEFINNHNCFADINSSAVLPYLLAKEYTGADQTYCLLGIGAGASVGVMVCSIKDGICCSFEETEELYTDNIDS